MYNLKQTIQSLFTVKDLKNLLNSYPDDMPIGVVGWFGEYYTINKYNFSKSNAYITPKDNWRDNNGKHIDILAISTPDIGESPD